jgi:transporter family-2 protein
MPKALLLVLGFAAGAMAAVQAVVNARLRQAVASPFQVALLSFGVGTLALTGIVSVTARSWAGASLSSVPWWAWTGGILGAGYITTAVVLAPRIGALALMALVIAGQILAALALDHFGLFGLRRVPVSPSRLAGAALLLAGLFFVLRRGQ